MNYIKYLQFSNNEQSQNRKNDRIWSAQAPGISSVVEHCQVPPSVLVWGGICTSGKIPLVFRDQGVKKTRKCTDAISSRLLYFLGPRSTSPMRNGCSSKTQHRPTELKWHRSGVRLIFRISLVQRNSHPTRQT